MTVPLPVGMQAAEDAVAMVRALLAEDGEALGRIIASTPNHGALASDLAIMVYLALRPVSETTREAYFTVALRTLQDNALDVRAPKDGPGPG